MDAAPAPPIVALETIPVALPFHEPYVTAAGTLERREMILLRLESDDGTEGWGDAVPLSLRGGDTLAEVQAALDDVCRPLLAGAEPDRDSLLDACADAGVPAPALAAVDSALLDLLGRASERAAWQLLGASSARSIDCNGTLGGGDPDVVGAAASELAEKGFRTLKVKVGIGDDVGRVGAVRDAVLGHDAKLRVDANGTWSVAMALERLQEMAPFNIELAEQPCMTTEDLAAVRGRAAMPIVADESIASEADALRAEALGACDAATIKLAKVGGPRIALRIASIVPAYLSSALDSPLGIAAAFHAAQALPGDGFATGLAHGLATSGLFADNVAGDSWFRGPMIEPPVSAGLGVEIDREAIERLRIR